MRVNETVGRGSRRKKEGVEGRSRSKHNKRNKKEEVVGRSTRKRKEIGRK